MRFFSEAFAVVALLIAPSALALPDCNYPPTSVVVVPEGVANTAQTPLANRNRTVVQWTECESCPTCSGMVRMTPKLHCFCKADPLCIPFGYDEQGTTFQCTDTTKPWAPIFMATINSKVYGVMGRQVKIGSPANYFFDKVVVTVNGYAAANEVANSFALDANSQCTAGQADVPYVFEGGIFNVVFNCSANTGNSNLNRRLQVYIDYKPQLNDDLSGFCVDQSTTSTCKATRQLAWSYLTTTTPSVSYPDRAPLMYFGGQTTQAKFSELQFNSPRVGDFAVIESMTYPYQGITAHHWEWEVQYVANECFCDPAKYPVATYGANYKCCLFSDAASIQRCQLAKHGRTFP